MTTARQEIDSAIERLEHLNAETLADELGLWGWGKWSRAEGSTLGYPRCLLPFTAKGWGEKDLSRVITDIPEETAMQIDRAVATLPLQHRTVIVAIYRAWAPIRSLPLKMGMPRTRVEQYHNQAVGMLWAALIKTA
jgi:hypothetical protein